MPGLEHAQQLGGPLVLDGDVVGSAACGVGLAAQRTPLDQPRRDVRGAPCQPAWCSTVNQVLPPGRQALTSTTWSPRSSSRTTLRHFPVWPRRPDTARLEVADCPAASGPSPRPQRRIVADLVVGGHGAIFSRSGLGYLTAHGLWVLIVVEEFVRMLEMVDPRRAGAVGPGQAPLLGDVSL